MVMLKPGEKVLMEDKASCEGHGPGTLTLTSSRVIMEVTTGLISKKTHIALSLGLGSIEDVRIEGMLGKKLAVQGSDERTGRIDKYKLSVPNPNAWELAIKSAVQGT